eukprot:c9547_g1_i1.p1 GENE.c9547_g1_i1~~c9547_g1_i1.p1  ORF type:complete len:475 (+),score=110.86 c9547_g1_i1:34-1425(+)
MSDIQAVTEAVAATTIAAPQSQPEAPLDTPLPLVKELHPDDESAQVVVSGVEEPAHLRSEVTFEALKIPKPILDAIYRLNFAHPSQIQARTIPAILEGKSVIGQAQTGSGKTLCFAIGMLNQIDPTQNVTQGLCLAPTRELALQIYNAITDIAHFMPTVRGTVAIPQNSRPDVALTQHFVVGTPGTVKDYVNRALLSLDHLKVCAIDEADQMIQDQTLGAHTKQICKNISTETQVLLFSATYENPQTKKIAHKLVGENSIEVLVKREELSLEGIQQFSVMCSSQKHKLDVLDEIFETLTIGQTIIFVERRVDADRVAEFLRSKKHSVTQLTGGLESNERDAAMKQFRTGVTKVLIATSVLARGIDVLQVNLIINFDVPRIPIDPANLGRGFVPDPQTYLHRSGRSARFGRSGVTLNLLDGPESVSHLQAISDHWQKPIVPLDPANLEQTLQKALTRSAKAAAK